MRRSDERQDVSLHFLALSSRFLLVSMLALSIGLSIDYYVVASLLFETSAIAIAAAVLFAILVSCWFAFPYWRRAQDRARGQAS